MLTDLPMRTVRDQVLLLRSLPGFAPLDDEALALFGEHSRVRPVRAGERLLTLGEPIHHVYIVLAGCVRWQRKDRPENVAGRHQVVGWITAMAREPNGLDAVVTEDGMVLELPTEILERALEHHFSIVRNLLRLGASTLVRRRGLLPVRPERASPAELGPPGMEKKTLVERVIGMRAAPIFQRCSVEALIALTRAAQEVRYSAGDVLWARGETTAFWVIVEWGRIVCTTESGESVTVGSGFVLGIMDVIALFPRSYQARAETDVIAYRIELSAYLGILEAHHDLARDSLALFAENALED